MELRVNFNFFTVLVIFLLVFSSVASAASQNTFENSSTSTESGSSAPFRITLFIPASKSIHSDQIQDQINTPDGGVLFGTTYGLSLFNGTWSTRHINRDNISQGLMDEFITAIEYDHDRNLWIGYSGGVQIYNGEYYLTLRDQQLFKDPRIQDLQRWHDDMWVATGNSGIHRFRDGIWTWFQPMTENGPGFYEIREMVLDPAEDSLIITTYDNGTWIVRSPDDPVIFEQIASKGGSYPSPQHVRRDPHGGVYFFNDTTVIHYSGYSGFTPVLTVQDLTREDISVNDLAAASDGKIFLATDKGIFIWKNSKVYQKLGRFEGIGTSERVRTIIIDSHNRVWFSTEGYVGYYEETSESQNLIPIQIVTPVTDKPAHTSVTIPIVSRTEVIPATISQPESAATQDGLAPILNPILRAITSILSKLGIVR
jgi:ligand-binding sensor domain-containing protein